MNVFPNKHGQAAELIAKIIELVHSDKFRQRTIQVLKQMQPVEAVAMQSAMVVFRLFHSLSKDKGMQIDTRAALHAITATVKEVAQYAKLMKIDFTPAMLKEASIKASDMLEQLINEQGQQEQQPQGLIQGGM